MIVFILTLFTFESSSWCTSQPHRHTSSVVMMTSKLNRKMENLSELNTHYNTYVTLTDVMVAIGRIEHWSFFTLHRPKLVM